MSFISLLNVDRGNSSSPGHKAAKSWYGGFLSNTPDTSGNVAVRLIAYALAGLDHFIQVSLLPDLNKMMPKDVDP